MTKGTSEKYNDSCLKIFALISLFSKGETKFEDVIKLFADENGKVAQISNVTLNKYMNTLKIFGIDVRKKKGIYYLHKMPFSITLEESELRAVALMKSALAFMVNSKIKKELSLFIEELEKRYDYKTKQLDTVVKNTRSYDLTFYFMKFKKQIAECEKYCQEGNKLYISYINQGNQEIRIDCDPLEVKYNKDSVLISVYSPRDAQVFDIPVESILSINLISKNQKIKSKKCTAVKFKLRGNLAKSYKLREWEQSEGYDENGWLTIINSGEDFAELANRLFKYNINCVVISPKYLKTQVSKMIDETLKNYL